MTQAEKLLDYLKHHPEGISLQDIRNYLFIMNPMQAAKDIRDKHRTPVETFEVRRTSNNRPVSGYRLMNDGSQSELPI